MKPGAAGQGAPPALAIGIVLHDLGLGGTERIALRLAREWVAGGARVTIFCGIARGELKDLVPPDADLVEASPAIARSWGSRRRLARAAQGHFAANPVDIAYVPGNFHWCVVPALAAIPGSARPAIVARISNALARPGRGPLRQWLFFRRMRRQLGRADAVVALSPSLGREVARVLEAGKVQVIASPVLDDRTPPPVGVPAGAPLLLAAGRLVPEKGFAMLIRAFSRLKDGQARLVIPGEGPQRPELERLIRLLGLEGRVRLPGYVKDTRPWLDQARGFVLSSRFEGYPAVLVEALAAGRPVVATRCTPAIDDLDLAALGGIVVPPDEEAALAQALEMLLDRAMPDPSTLASRVEHHRIGAVACEYLRLFAALSQARAASGA